jgi:RNA polymerase sigma-70 factor (ECF subfamily)
VREVRQPDPTSADADDRLMTAVQQGDVARLGVLFERHHRALFNFFLRLTGEREAAEDLVSDVFLRILKYRATYQPGTQFRTWMYHLARNAHIDRFKARRKEYLMDPDEPREPASDAPSPGASLEHREKVALLKAALARLSEEKREVILLCRFSGLKYEEIARMLGCEVGALKVRMHRAVRALRDVYFDLTGEQSSCSANT